MQRPAFILGPLPADPRLQPQGERFLLRSPEDDTATPTTEYTRPGES